MDTSPRPKRTSNACQRCRSRKVKCSGTHPCDKCRQRRQNCIFEEDRKIVVSEELFLSLKRRIEELEGPPSQRPRKRARTIRSETPVREDSASQDTPDLPREPTPDRHEDEEFASNPLVSPSTYVKNNDPRKRTWLFLGPTSTWSFSRRVLSIVQARLCPDSAEPIPLAVDGDAYQLHWRQASSDELPDISGLPSLEHALYILNTVQFHFSHLYRLFDEKDFIHNLYEFYEDAARKVQDSRLWYVQFLVILAFGDAFLAPVRRTSNITSWTKFFSRAMSLLPDVTVLWQSSLLAIETLTLIALYFQSIDMRDTAYCYIGLASKIALVEAFHRELPVDQLGPELVERAGNIWWTVYVLDRKFASMIGSPNSCSDAEITAVLWDPRTSTQKEAALSLHVKISQVTTRVLNTVYSTDGTLGGVFLRKVRSVLQEMTNLSRELEDVFAHRFSSSVDALSGVTTRLTLSCHLCIIVTTRPLVLSLLRERISCFEDGDVFRSVSAPVRTLLEACIDSATKSLRLLSALRDQNILESFLPFDLENLFSSFFILTVISAILPDTLSTTDIDYKEMGSSLLDDMISRGNRIAQLRKSEIELLEEFMQPLVQAPTQPFVPDTARPHPPLDHHPHIPNHDASNLPSLETLTTASTLPSTVPAVHEDELGCDWRDFGLSLDHMLSVTDQLNTNNLVLDAEREGLQTDLWLWSDG